MSPGIRKFVLTVHLISSVGWIGSVVAYLALGVWAISSQEAHTARAAWMAMEVTGWFATVPLALAALVTGVVVALGTPWGLFRHYWVVLSLVLTIICTVVLLQHMTTVSYLVQVTAQSDGAVALGGDLFHPGVGLVLLLVIAVLNVYKPRGLTPYGWRKQQEERARLARCASALAPVTSDGGEV